MWGKFIEERHVPADGWLAFYQVHVLAGVGNVRAA